MKLQDLIFKSHGQEDHLVRSGEIIRVTDRTMRRWRERLEEHG